MATVTNLTGLVLRKNRTDFFTGVDAVKLSTAILPAGFGVIFYDIPTPGLVNTGARIDGDYWAVPVTSDGVVSGFVFRIAAVKPDPQAIACFRLSKERPFGDDIYYILGTVAQYVTASNGGAALPLVAPGAPIASCQKLCNQNVNGLYFGMTGIPTVDATFTNLYAYGLFNGVALPALAAAGYANAAALLTAIQGNTTWNAIGTWSLSADNKTLIVTQAAGPGTDTLCIEVRAVNPAA